MTLAVQAMKAGAVDWLETPYEKDELLAAVASAMANIQRTTNESARGSPRSGASPVCRRANGKSSMAARRRHEQDDRQAAGYQSAHGGNASRQRHGATRCPHLARSRADGGGGHPPAARARSNAFR